MRILLVQANRDSTAAFTSAFQAGGYEVLSTTSGEQAIRLALEHRPDVIVTELVLPIVDGWQLLQVLRTYGPLRETPFLALSPHGLPQDRSRALESGFSDFLPLPIDPLALADAVDRVVGNGG